MDWLHRNDNYERRGKSTCDTYKNRLLTNRALYINMEESKKERLLHSRRDYKKIKSSCNKMNGSADNYPSPGEHVCNIFLIIC